MGFPVNCSEVTFPKLLVYTISVLAFIRSLITALFHRFGLSDFIETEPDWPESPNPIRLPENPPLTALLIREILPVIKFEELRVERDPLDSCSVCLCEFGGGEEIRWLRNCKHVFHRDCLDRWMDHEQVTCPLCRCSFVPDECLEEFNQRLWAATSRSGVDEFYIEEDLQVLNLE